MVSSQELQGSTGNRQKEPMLGGKTDLTHLYIENVFMRDLRTSLPEGATAAEKWRVGSQAVSCLPCLRMGRKEFIVGLC